MKENKPNRRVGVFMDHRIALFITEENGTAEFTLGNKIEADEDRSNRGEHHYNNSKRDDTRQYYKLVAHELLPYDEIFIFGPGKSQEEFINWLHTDVQFKMKQIKIGSADYVSDNQKVALVRDHFDK